ncbi:MAG: hypothetical protein Q8J74_13195 [Candidatus Didemnitutus sp.]|nr:hypothetical protein [Candidatus Didemnitutus sp.]
MSALAKIQIERLVFGLAMLGVLASGTWWWRQQPKLRALRHQQAPVSLSGENYLAAKFRPLDGASAAWASPAAQSHGPGWVYEVFTPPVIYYHAAARSFAVTPPSTSVEGGGVFGLELLDVKWELYRLQLLGYVGEQGDYLAAFVSSRVPQTLLARTGKRFADLGLVLKEFTVRKVKVGDDPAFPAYDIAAVAILQDEATGEVVSLDDRVRKYTNTPLAVLRLDAKSQPREAREGDVFHDKTATLRIERIQLDPPEVVVARLGAGLTEPEIRVLRPVGGDGVARDATPVEKRFRQRAGIDVATVKEDRR